MAETEKDGGQAYPAAWGNPEQGGDYVPGMSLRDAAAIACLAQIAGNQVDPDVTIDKNAEVAAYWAFAFADAMLIARATGEKEPRR